MKINEVRGVIADAIIGYRCLTVLQQDTPDVSDETIEIMQAISEDAHADADAILTALSEKGMVIVPKEPTEAMLDAGDMAYVGHRARMAGIYRAMLSASDGEAGGG